MQTITLDPLGPFGPLSRGAVRTSAFNLGVTYDEHKSLLTSHFRFTGPVPALRKLIAHIRKMQEDADRAAHGIYVDTMEKAEKRRAKWGRLIGRRTRTAPLTREESNEVFLFLCETMWEDRIVETEAASERRSEGMSTLTPLLDDKDSGHDYALGVLAAIRMRYLQHDVRTGAMKVSRDLKQRILAMKVPMDTWDA